jgi:hypothetical protein
MRAISSASSGLPTSSVAKVPVDTPEMSREIVVCLMCILRIYTKNDIYPDDHVEERHTRVALARRRIAVG